MRYALCILLFWLLGPSIQAQSVTIDIEYQPSTTYEMIREYRYDNWSETFAEDGYKKSMEANGLYPSGESKGSAKLTIRMAAGERVDDYIPFTSVIAENRDSVEVNRFLQDDERPKLDTDDIIYYGKINRFQKMEIDSIIGVDSLSEKNKAFVLLDDIHRFISYPKDTFEINEVVKETEGYGRERDGVFPATKDKTYRLDRVEGDMAYFDITFKYYQGPNESAEERKTKISGEGKGELIYDIKNKLVVAYGYVVEINQYYDYDFIAHEYLLKSTYSWTMKIVE